MNSNLFKTLVVVLLAGIAGLLLGRDFFPATQTVTTVSSAPSEQPVYERMLKDHTMRCGYFVYAPYIVKDPNTGALSGSFYDLTEKLGQILGLKVEWTQETTFSTFIEDMKSGRYDVFCGGLWPLSDTAPYMAYTQSVFYTGYYVYVRANDHRFDDDISKINDPSISFATIDGETSSIIRDQDFAQSKAVSLPNTSDVAQLLLNLVDSRADVTATEPSVAELFIKSHPGSIRPLNLSNPARIFATVWAVPGNEQRLVGWLNTGVEEMLGRGVVEPIVRQYHGNAFLPVSHPYILPPATP